jgi:Rrf2 family protein
MSITRRADYAVRLMYELAQLPAGISLSIKDLCDAADVPEMFGEPLVQFLAEAQLVNAAGYRSHLLSLSRPASQITMAEVVRTCEPAFSLAACAHDPNTCDRSSHRGVHRMWGALDAVLWAHLERLTLEQVARGVGLPDMIGAEAPVAPGLLGRA